MARLHSKVAVHLLQTTDDGTVNMKWLKAKQHAAASIHAAPDAKKLPRVFVIGFNKCGTRTIHSYFKSNGYQSVHWDYGKLAKAMYQNLREAQPILSGYEQYTIFSDMEWIVAGIFAFEGYKLYPHLYNEYPQATFILNTRNVEHWLESRLKHGKGGYARCWKRILKIETDVELLSYWRTEWNRHHEKVESFFRNKPARFLRFDIEVDAPELINGILPEYSLNPRRYRLLGQTLDGSGPVDTEVDFSAEGRARRRKARQAGMRQKSKESAGVG